MESSLNDMVKEYKDNRSLQKYENKAPDFDYLERESKFKTSVRRYILREDGCWADPKQERSGIATLVFAGDLLCQEKQMFEAETAEGYDFHYAFDLVSPILKKADLSIGNLETPICECAPYRTERYVSEQMYYNNAPVTYLDAVADAGIDFVTTANNHDLDAGAIGLGATIDHCQRIGLIQTGTFKQDDRHFQIVDVNGIKIAFVAFTTSHNMLSCNYFRDGRETLINTYSLSKAKFVYRQMKEYGAQFTVVCMHWGKEYKHQPSEEQKDAAHDLAEAGYDLIVGSHPHVIQYYEEIATEDGRIVPVIYSLGNFVSHQRKSKSYLSLIFKAVIAFGHEKQSCSVRCSYIPCCTAKELFGKKYIVLPLCQEIGNALPQEEAEAYRTYIAEQVGGIIAMDPFTMPALADDTIFKWQKSAHIDEKKPSLDAYEREIGKILKQYPNAVNDKAFFLNNESEEWRLLGLSKTTQAVIIPTTIAGKKIVSIQKRAFLDNPLIKKINFPSYLSVLSESVCEGCSNLEGVILSKHLKIVGKRAFRNCSSLHSMVLRREVTNVEAYAFENCVSLRSIKIPENVTKIDDTAFQNCPELIIFGLKNTYSEQYAVEHKIPFRSLEGFEDLL